MSTDSVAFERVCESLVEAILAGDLERGDLEAAKLDACREHASPKVPKNTDLLDHAPADRREDLAAVVRRKPVRTASGVSPVAAMTSPHTCPHGKCLYCPGGPASEFSSAQSYTGHEPAAARGVRSHDYQEWFVKRALEAMNNYDLEAPPSPSDSESFAPDPDEVEFRYLEDVIAENETADVRNVGTTFETKPDWCGREQIDRMLRLGGTKVEVGVQTTYERINREMHRGHGVGASLDANRRLRDAAFKIGFHMMPGQPGMSKEMCLQDFRELFDAPEWQPDYLKIYPTLVVRDTVTYDMWRRGEYEPLTNEEAAELVAEIKSMIPRYTRLQRVQRDIPADFIDAGVWKSNLRQLARQRMAEHGWTCECIRCREVGMNDEEPENVEMDVLTYEAAGGTEHFISIEDFEKDLLVGFCRLRFPDEPIREELQDAALVRELHVYGDEVGVGSETARGSEASAHQHEGYGRRLLRTAEDIARDAGFRKLAVISGVGVRQYYREKLGYYQDGPYVSTRLQ
ncbi:tRNA uridine(34) 5-carboxymethylaminomethyl modification radical SAM/GNAT enzyme Elp3 [Halobacteriales archaeon QH_7_69_31]|nr:MAG: tRNA uridine(34) 5-carboxymethylaminomethyl modification radical SAM/GNAT enzyme Elp3 [Halobacteriales archaeon QH_7_69_31]